MLPRQAFGRGRLTPLPGTSTVDCDPPCPQVGSRPRTDRNPLMAAPDEPLASLPAHPGVAASLASKPAVESSGPGPAENVALMRRLDAALVGLVLAFAFLVASFPARRTDVFEHLAAGRLVAHGEYPFGSDPFTVPGARAPGGWVNHAWLSDLVLYLL